MSDLALRIQVWVTTTLASLKEERGQDLTEYALWTGVIALTLTGIGATSTLRYIEGAGHGGAQFTSAENLALVDNFFDTHLRGQSIENNRQFSIFRWLSE